jgi:hypothetical protein
VTQRATRSATPAQLTAFLPGAAGCWEARRARPAGAEEHAEYPGVLHAALRDAVRWGYLPRNVAVVADLPKGITPSHVLPGLDAQAADTVARRILGDGDQEPTRPVDNPSTEGRKAAVGERR